MERRFDKIPKVIINNMRVLGLDAVTIAQTMEQVNDIDGYRKYMTTDEVTVTIQCHQEALKAFCINYLKSRNMKVYEND